MYQHVMKVRYEFLKVTPKTKTVKKRVIKKEMYAVFFRSKQVVKVIKLEGQKIVTLNTVT